MNIKVLISTMNKNNITDLELERKHINNCIIVNQTTREMPIQHDENASMISYIEKGLAKSRNRLLDNIPENTDIAIISDDDVSFVEGYEEKIKKAYEEIEDADIIIFKSLDENGNPRRNYKNKTKKLNKLELLSVCSIEITFKVNKIKNKIRFNEQFGLAGIYKSGEENIFLEECRRKGLNIYFYNEFINIHPAESTGMEEWSEKDISDKGALFKELFPKTCYVLVIPICVLKRKNLKKGIFNAIKTMYKGMFKYSKMVKNK